MTSKRTEARLPDEDVARIFGDLWERARAANPVAREGAILISLEPLFAEAEREGKWFWTRYEDLWFSPAQLRAEHARGRGIWRPEYWKLRDPQERIAEAEKRAASALAELERIISEVEAWRASR